MVQIAELKLYSDGTDITQEKSSVRYDSTTTTSSGGTYPSEEKPVNLVDGGTSTKWLDYRFQEEGTASAVWVTVEFSTAQQVTGNEWFTANDATERDPSAWRLQGSNDNSTWTDLDIVTGFTATDTRGASAGTWTIDYSPALAVSTIEVASGKTLALGVAPATSFTKTGAGTLVASAGIGNRIDMKAGGLDLNGNKLSVTTAILPKDGSVAFYNGTYSMNSDNWNIGDDTPAEWIIGEGASFLGAQRLVLSPESADRSCSLVIKDGGSLTTGVNPTYIQHHDLGTTTVEITGESSSWTASRNVFFIPSNDNRCTTPTANFFVTDGASFTINENSDGANLTWGRRTRSSRRIQ